MMTPGFSRLSAGLICMLSLCATSVKADDISDFYKSQRLNFIVPTSAGGGFDLHSRILMEFMANYIPGKPRAVLQNMPGAGGVLAANYVYKVAPKDGGTIGMALSSIPMAEALQTDEIQYKSSGFGWIGTITTETEVLAVWKTSGVTSIEEARQKSVPIGATGKLGTLGLNTALANALLGTKFKVVYGYPGSTEINMAMDGREVQGRTNQWTSWKTQSADWVQEGKLAYLLQIGPKDPELTQVPSFMDLVSTPGDKAMVALLQSNQLMGRSIYAPPNVPPARLAALRAAFDKTLLDPGYLARVKQAGLELVNPCDGDTLAASITDTMSTSAQAAADIKKLLNL
jgi:tripartite-type tricarboxylate transporter receptor subunit TctC